jgi:hypothetical protein
MKSGVCCFQVSVRLPYAEYQHVPAVEMQLMVVANLIIDPADIYLLKGDSVQYRILQVSSLSVLGPTYLQIEKFEVFAHETVTAGGSDNRFEWDFMFRMFN